MNSPYFAIANEFALFTIFILLIFVISEEKVEGIYFCFVHFQPIITLWLGREIVAELQRKKEIKEREIKWGKEKENQKEMKRARHVSVHTTIYGQDEIALFSRGSEKKSGKRERKKIALKVRCIKKGKEKWCYF